MVFRLFETTYSIMWLFIHIMGIPLVRRHPRTDFLNLITTPQIDCRYTLATFPHTIQFLLFIGLLDQLTEKKWKERKSRHRYVI